MPRTTLMAQRSYDAQDLDKPVTCPAGERIGEVVEGPGCRCRIEGSTITAAKDGSSLAIFCMGDNTLCPTWRLARETEWEHEAVMAIASPSGVHRSFSVETLEEIEERRAAGDAASAARLAGEVYEARRAQGIRDVSRG